MCHVTRKALIPHIRQLFSVTSEMLIKALLGMLARLPWGRRDNVEYVWSLATG